MLRAIAAAAGNAAAYGNVTALEHGGPSPAILADLPGTLARVPPEWFFTLGLSLLTILTLARRKQGQDAFLLLMLLLSGVFCVIYLCVAGDVLHG